MTDLLPRRTVITQHAEHKMIKVLQNKFFIDMQALKKKPQTIDRHALKIEEKIKEKNFSE